MTTPEPRRVIAVLTHVYRRAAIDAAVDFVTSMAEAGIGCVVFPEAIAEMRERVPGATLYPKESDNAHGAELVVVFGGDGTILRASEWAIGLGIPVLGVNLGHVGFLAELESSETGVLVEKVITRSYQVEHRVTVEVELRNAPGGDVVWSSFAINEVSLEKACREKMIEVIAQIDGLPVSRWGCDGILVATPTGSTAYAFSAGGPVMWPQLEAFLLVPLSAHALFARPLVLGPESVVEVDLLPGSNAVVWCDGRRSADVSEGGQITVRRSPNYLKLVRLSEQPFTSRLVKKFDLRVEGWRGGAAAAAEA